jgi:hypothetical protein
MQKKGRREVFPASRQASTKRSGSERRKLAARAPAQRNALRANFMSDLKVRPPNRSRGMRVFRGPPNAYNSGMAFQQLSPLEKDIVRQAMRAVIDGPFIDDWEFHARMGVYRPEAQTILRSWPDLDDSTYDSATFLTINNSLNELCYGLWISDEEWSEWLSVPREELRRIYVSWARLAGLSGTGIR